MVETEGYNSHSKTGPHVKNNNNRKSVPINKQRDTTMNSVINFKWCKQTSASKPGQVSGLQKISPKLTISGGDWCRLRKEGTKIAANRPEYIEVKEGYVYGKVTADGKTGVVMLLLL